MCCLCETEAMRREEKRKNKERHTVGGPTRLFSTKGSECWVGLVVEVCLFTLLPSCLDFRLGFVGPCKPGLFSYMVRIIINI